MIPTLPALRKIKPQGIHSLFTHLSLYSSALLPQIAIFIPAFILASGLACFAPTGSSTAAVHMETKGSSVLHSPSGESSIFEKSNGTMTIRTPRQSKPPPEYYPDSYLIEPAIILPYGTPFYPHGTPRNSGQTP